MAVSQGLNEKSPLKSLDGSGPKIENYQYPLDIDQLAHAIVFFINVSENSKIFEMTPGVGDPNSNIVRVIAPAGPQGGGLNIPGLNVVATTLRRTRSIKSNIALYVPETMMYDYNQSYEKPSLVEYAESIIKNVPLFGTLFGGAISGLVNVIRKGAPFTGYALNPVIEVLYSSPTLRKFQFDFTFAPKNEKESEQVINIIKQFRMHQAPEVVSDTKGMLFIPPSEFDIEFKMNRNGSFVENPNVPKISTCVLESMNVNYAPQNQFVTFEDGVPVQIQLRLAFLEVDMITRERVQLGF